MSLSKHAMNDFTAKVWTSILYHLWKGDIEYLYDPQCASKQVRCNIRINLICKSLNTSRTYTLWTFIYSRAEFWQLVLHFSPQFKFKMARSVPVGWIAKVQRLIQFSSLLPSAALVTNNTASDYFSTYEMHESKTFV